MVRNVLSPMWQSDFGTRRAVTIRSPEWSFEIQPQENGTLTINGIGGLDWVHAASQGAQKRNAGQASSAFALDDVGADTANISSDAKILTASDADLQRVLNQGGGDLPSANDVQLMAQQEQYFKIETASLHGTT